MPRLIFRESCKGTHCSFMHFLLHSPLWTSTEQLSWPSFTTEPPSFSFVPSRNSLREHHSFYFNFIRRHTWPLKTSLHSIIVVATGVGGDLHFCHTCSLVERFCSRRCLTSLASVFFSYVFWFWFVFPCC